MDRLPDLTPETMTPAQQAAYDAIKAGPRGVVQGPLRSWLQSPELAERAQALGAFCRYGTSLPPRLSELAILVTGSFWQAGFEWAVHAPIGLAAGLDPVAVEALRTDAVPAFPNADEQAVYEFARELLHNHKVTDARYSAAVEAVGAVAVVELVGILGYYGLISMTINAFQVDLPDGAPDPFPAKPEPC